MPAGRLPAFEREQRHLDEPRPAVPAAKREDIGVDLVGRAAGEADPGSLLGHGRVFGMHRGRLSRRMGTPARATTLEVSI